MSQLLAYLCNTLVGNKCLYPTLNIRPNRNQELFW